MSVPLRSGMGSFYSTDKNRSDFEAPTRTEMSYNYSSTSSTYAGGSGDGGADHWTNNQRQPCSTSDNLTDQDQERRWYAQQGSGHRSRDPKATEIISTRHSGGMTSSQPIQLPSLSQGLSGPIYGGSSTHQRSATHQSQYGRNASPMAPMMSNWNNGWDIEDRTAVSMNSAYAPGRYSESQTSWTGQLNADMPSYDHPPYHGMMISGSECSSPSLFASDSIALGGYNFPHRLDPHDSSPSPPSTSPKIKRSPGPGTPLPRSMPSRNEDRPEGPKSCSHCRATTTPLWRRDPVSMRPLCNACGLYLQQRNKLRPQELIDADGDASESEESDPNYSGPQCTHCRTHNTSVWRRSKTGEQLCNACGVYARLRGKPRPLTLKKHKIRPRSKHAPST